MVLVLSTMFCVGLALTLVASYFLLRVFFHVLSGKLKIKLGIDLSIDSFGLFCFKDIQIKKSEKFCINIKKIALVPGFFQKEYCKPIYVVIGPVKVDFLYDEQKSPSEISKQKEKDPKTTAGTKQTKASVFIRMLLYVLQHIGLDIPEVVLSISNGELDIMGRLRLLVGLEFKYSEVSKRRIGASIDLKDVAIKISEENSPVLDCAFQLAIQASVLPDAFTKSCISKVTLSQLVLTCREGALKHAATRRRRNTSQAVEEVEIESAPELKMNSLLEKLDHTPKEVIVILENCKFVYVSSKEREIYLSWHCELSWRRSLVVDELAPKTSYNVAVDLTGLVVNTTHNKLLLNKHIECSLKLTADEEEPSCALLCSWDTLHASFIQEELQFWSSEIAKYSFSTQQPASNLQLQSKPKPATNWLSLMKSFHWTVDVNLKNCSCDLIMTSADSQLPHPILNTYLGEMEMKMEKELDSGAFCGMFRCSIMLQDLYAYVNRNWPKNSSCVTCVDGTDKPAVLPCSENHVWGRLLEIGKISFKAGCKEFTLLQSKPMYMNGTCEVNFVAIEWSLAVAYTLKRTFQVFSTLRKDSTKLSARDEKPSKDISLLHMDAEFRVVNINLFCLGDRNEGANSLLAKMDGVDISTGSAEEPMLWQINGLKISRLLQIHKDQPLFCHNSKSMKSHIVHAPSISACFFRKLSPKKLTVSIQDCSVDWDTSKHMVLYEQMKFLLEARDSFQAILPNSSKTPKKVEKSLQTEMKLDIITAELKLQTSKHNRFGIKTENLCLESNRENASAKACDLDVLFDDKAIFKFQEIELKKISGAELTENRQMHPSISLENKKAWELSMESCHMIFPYQFDFASSLESLLNVTKMLKVLHKKPKKADFIEPVHPDLLLKCNFLSFELEDDPFEVKLEENYYLRMDEMEECLERETKLIQKLNDLQGAFVSSKKVEEIMKSLAEKNAQIYIKRSMAIHQDISKRTFLLKCSFRNIRLAIMADESLNGKDNIINKMKEINKESPLPDDITFNTLWCRKIEGNLKFLMISIRDYQQPLMQIENFKLSGTLIGAEQAGSELATREAWVEIGAPWSNMKVKKNMPALKFYHDLVFDMDFFQAGWGVNFEPAFGMVTQSLDLLSKASVDPSTPLPFWDKMRLLLHGNLEMRVRELNLVMSASRDPTNGTEKMVIVWERFLLTWANALICMEGDFDLQIRTASKYDDSRVMHFPAFKLRFDLEWLCEGNPNDHHVAIPCDPAKITLKVTHDSYRLFRSKNLNLSVSLKTGKDLSKEELKINPPTVFLYASTFRWFQKYRAVVLNNVSRPIRRGSYFKNIKPKKPTLGRHYKFVNMDFSFSRLRVNYFGSFTQDAGFEMSVSSGSFGASYQVHVENIFDDLDLIRRPVANWIVRDLRSELDKVSTDLISSLPDSDDESNKADQDAIETEEAKTYFLFSVKRVQYNRQSPSSDMSSYTHKVELNDFRGAWTALNRKITVELFEAYENMETLKRVLSSEALKASKDTKSQDFRRQHKGSFLDLTSSNVKNAPEQHISLLQQLVSEQQSKFMAQAEEGDTENEGQPKNPVEEDIIQLNWHIELTNSQVLLKCGETKGAMLITSANTQILKRLHRPVTANNDVASKLNKVTWTGKLSNLQYFATVKEISDLTSSSIPWLNASIFSGVGTKKESDAFNNVAAFMKSSDCIGSIVNVVTNGVTTELQRVVSPCQCEFYYVSLDPELDPFAEDFEATQYTSSRSNAAFSPPTNLANTLLIRHPSLEISTSPEQYAMFIEICQKLLLYTEPKKKEQQDRLEKMKFKMQLSTGQNIKGDIQEMQDSVRDSLSYLRRCERQLFDYRRKADNISLSMDEDSFLEMTLMLRERTNDLQEQIEAAKEQLSAESEELKIMIRTYKDLVQHSSASPSPNKGRSKNYIVKQSDVIFDDMRWRLTQQDGQLGIADVQFKKFHYNKLTFNDNAGEHRFELGGFSVFNLTPNATYKEVLIPHEVNLRRHVDKSVFLRVYCRVQSPVAGISIREHFEVNLCPIAVRLTHRFYHYLMSFFFPRRSANIDPPDTPEFDMGGKGKEEADNKESQNDETQSQATFKKPAPPRPPPPRQLPPSKTQPSSPQITVKPPASLPLSMNMEAEERKRKRPSLTLSLASPKDPPNQSLTSPSLNANTPSRTPSVKKSSSFYSRFSTDENVNRMRERAAKNQTFIYIKIPEIPICFSYKGEKERNIEDAHDFNLLLPTLEYHNRTWTWQDLSIALKKDYTQVLVPQIIKEKLHLKGGWDNKQSMAKKGDEDKAKLLLGEQLGTQKKAGKKLLFGKLSNLLSASKGSNDQTEGKDSEKSKYAELSGKGVDPLTLHDNFERLRTASSSANSSEK